MDPIWDSYRSPTKTSTNREDCIKQAKLMDYVNSPSQEYVCNDAEWWVVMVGKTSARQGMRDGESHAFVLSVLGVRPRSAVQNGISRRTHWRVWGEQRFGPFGFIQVKRSDDKADGEACFLLFQELKLRKGLYDLVPWMVTSPYFLSSLTGGGEERWETTGQGCEP